MSPGPGWLWRELEVEHQGLPQLGPDVDVSLYQLPALTDAQALEAVTGLGSMMLQDTSLSRLVLPGVQQLRSLTVWQNPSLEQVSMPALRTVEQLLVLVNDALVRLDLDNIESARDVEVRTNIRLYEGMLDHLLTLGADRVLLERNGESPAQLAPCSWTGDASCDEAGGLCAAGTDVDDCTGP